MEENMAIMNSSRKEQAELREKIIKTFSAKKGVRYRKMGQIAFVDESNKTYICCPISKRYDGASRDFYWFSLKRNHLEKMKKIGDGYYIFGCLGHDKAYAIPLNTINENIRHLNFTENENDFYWHIFLDVTRNGMVWRLTHGASNMNIEKFAFEV
jgi:hypothetical protein